MGRKIQLKESDRMKTASKFSKITNFIPSFVGAIFDKNTPISAKLMAILAIAYAIMPADLIADVIPVIGYLDDAIVFPLLIYMASRAIPEEIMNKHQEKDPIE